MAKPTSIKELQEWVETHKEDGVINGVSVIPGGRAEFRYGTVPGDLYDYALLVATPFGYTKSEIATIGANKLLSNALIDGAHQGVIVPGDFKDGTEFRAYFPQGLYDLVQKAKNQLNWSNSQLMTMVLTYFAYDPGTQKIYRQWLEDFSGQAGITPQEVEKAVYDRRRYLARVKRLELCKQRGEWIDDRKIAT